MTFGEKLQRLRARKGLSQDALAELLDVSRQAVSKWERDETMPEAEKIIRISDCFQVTTDYLLKDGPERFPERGHSLPDPGEVWNKYGFLLGWALAVWSGLGLVGRCGGLLIGWLSRQAEDIVVTQKEHSAGLVWFVLYGVVLAAGVLLCRRRKEQDP